jgi:hypothetical protein
MRTEELSHPVVRAVVGAMHGGDRTRFLAAFGPNAKLLDDGESQPLFDWVDREIFRAHGRLDVEREANHGLELVGRFHSDQWDMETVWKFDVANGRVRRLDVAAL